MERVIVNTLQEFSNHFLKIIKRPYDASQVTFLSSPYPLNGLTIVLFTNIKIG